MSATSLDQPWPPEGPSPDELLHPPAKMGALAQADPLVASQPPPSPTPNGMGGSVLTTAQVRGLIPKDID